MKFKAKTKELVDALQISTSIVRDNVVIPIYREVKFELQLANLLLTSSDIQNTLIKEIEVEGEQDGVICIDGKLLLSVLRTLSDPTISMELDGKRMKLISLGGVYEFAVSDPKDYPKLPKMDEVSSFDIDAEVLSDGIAKTLFAVSDSQSESIGNLLLRMEGNSVFIVGCDTPRLVEFNSQSDAEHNFSLLLNKKSANLLKQFLVSGTVTFQYNKRFLMTQVPGVTIYTLLSEGTFPDYKRIIPLTPPHESLVDRISLLSAIKRLIILANASTHYVVLQFSPNAITVRTEDVDYNRAAKEVVDAQYSGETLDIGFNGKLLVDVLSAIDTENVSVHTTDAVRPVIFKPEGKSDYTGLVATYNL